MDPALGARLHALRTARGISLRALAHRIPCSHVHLHNVERGRAQPSPDLLDRLDRALDAGGQLVDAHAGRLAHAAQAPHSIDQATVDALAGVLASLRHLDDVAGAVPAAAAVDAHWPLVTALGDNARGPVRPAAVGLAGQWAQFRGWLATASHDTATASRMWDRATAAAVEVDDRDLLVTVDSFRGYAAWRAGQVGRALEATEAAMRRSDGVCVDQRAYDHYQLARLRAARGETGDARDALARGRDLAAQALESSAPRPPWHYYRGNGFWCLETAMVHAELGDRRRAEEAYAAGVATLPAEHTHAEWLAQYTDRVYGDVR